MVFDLLDLNNQVQIHIEVGEIVIISLLELLKPLISPKVKKK